jgi:hypothetical protein
MNQIQNDTALLMHSFCEHYQPAHERAWARYKARVAAWKDREHPECFYLWLAWMILHPVFWVVNCIQAWLYRRRQKRIKIGDFSEYRLPAIRKQVDYGTVADMLLNVQPMTGPLSDIFYINYNDEKTWVDTWVDTWGWGMAR